MRLLYIAEIVGKPGLFALRHTLEELKQRYQPDILWGNGDGATGGFGLGLNHAHTLRKLGLQVITLGECAFYKKDVHPLLASSHFLLRPENLPEEAPGQGWQVLKSGPDRVAFLSLVGQAGWNRLTPVSPFTAFDRALERLQGQNIPLLIDFHAVTTAEKQTLLAYVDGKVAALLGSHAKVATADAQITSHGTAYVTDAGRTGSRASIGGFLPEKELQRLQTGIPLKSEPCWQELVVEGVFLELSHNKGVRIEPFTQACSVRAPSS
ncbi:MAG: YmdB family metallophosphoesterase [Spirochaetales bacterium]|nr:YmdB family metallophosphoesterase [Spirochaetales bacterium]